MERDPPSASRLNVFAAGDGWNRYRARFEEESQTSPDFFPDVGIAPVSNGGLLSAGLFVAERLGLTTSSSPHDFVEAHAFSNWCKFSIRATTNKDYIADVPKLTASLPFVVGELTVLQPAVVLVHARVWGHPILKAAMRGACPTAFFIPIPQFNPRVVNIHLAGVHRKGVILQRASASSPLAEWMRNLRGFTPANAWRYLARLEVLLKTRENNLFLT